MLITYFPTLSECAYLLLALFFGILIRLPFHVMLAVRFESGKPPGDLSGVLTKLEDMSRRRWVSYQAPDSVVEGIFAYPVFFHWLVSRFPESQWRRVSVALNIAPDLLAATAVFVVVIEELPWVAAGEITRQDSLSVAFCAALILLTLPILLPITARQKATNGRAFGTLLVSLTWLSVAVLMEGGHWIIYFIAVVTTIATMLTSMFGLQVIVFSVIPLAVAYQNIAPIAVVVAAFFIAWAIPALGARDVLRFKFQHFLWYRRNKHHVVTTAFERTFFKPLWTLPKQIFRSPHEARALLLSKAPLLIAMYSLPPAWFLFWSLGGEGTLKLGWENPVIKFCLATLAASLLVFVITSLQAFLEWGQAERYFEYTAPMLVVATILIGFSSDFGWLGLICLLSINIAVLLLLHVYSFYPVLRLINRYPTDTAEREVASFLAKQPIPVRMSALPQQMQRYWPRFFRGSTDAKPQHFFTYILQDSDHLFDGFSYMDDVFGDSYQVPSITPQQFNEMYGIRYIVGLKWFVKQNSEEPFIMDLNDHHELIFENDKYLVFRVVEGP